jgi:hypothetical protein
MKKLKKWLSGILSGLLLIVLFGIIFINLGLVELTPSYFVELGLVTVLTFLLKTTWYDSTEENRLDQPDIKRADCDYDDMIDNLILDVDDFEKFLKELDDENKSNYIKYKMGSKTPENYGFKKYKRLFRKFTKRAFKKFPTSSQEDIKAREEYVKEKMQDRTAKTLGQEKYTKKLYRATRRADKIKPLKSSDIMTRGESKKTYDSKDYSKSKKRMWAISSTIFSAGITIGLAAIAFQSISVSWESAFRYLTYVYSMLQTIILSIIKANKNTYIEHMDYLSRLTVILKKYSNKKGGVVVDGNESSSAGVRNSSII